MQPQPGIAFSNLVADDLQALVGYLHSRSGGYNPAVGIPLDGIMDFIRSHPGTGVVSVPPGSFGMPVEITPVHDALDRLQMMQRQGAEYAIGLAELTVQHGMDQPADIDFMDRYFPGRNLERLPEPLRVAVQAIQVAVAAHLIVVIPDPFRPGTLVLVVLLSPHDRWSYLHEKAVCHVVGAEEAVRRQLFA